MTQSGDKKQDIIDEIIDLGKTDGDVKNDKAPENKAETDESVDIADVDNADEKDAGEAKDKDKDKKKEKKTDKSELKRLTAELAAAKKAAEEASARAAETSDKYLRVVAEYDNYRRRSVKEREGVYSDAYADAVNALLPLLDNLGRAAAYGEPEKTAEGVALALKALPEVFAKMGVEELPAEKFDPELHNAVMHEDDPEAGEGVIAEVFQKGYRRGDKIIRHAMVKVVN